MSGNRSASLKIAGGLQALMMSPPETLFRVIVAGSDPARPPSKSATAMIIHCYASITGLHCAEYS